MEVSLYGCVLFVFERNVSLVAIYWWILINLPISWWMLKNPFEVSQNNKLINILD